MLASSAGVRVRSLGYPRLNPSVSLRFTTGRLRARVRACDHDVAGCAVLSTVSVRFWLLRNRRSGPCCANCG